MRRSSGGAFLGCPPVAGYRSVRDGIRAALEDAGLQPPGYAGLLGSVFRRGFSVAAITLMAGGTGIVSVVLTVFVLNLRHVLYGVSLGKGPPPKVPTTAGRGWSWTGCWGTSRWRLSPRWWPRTSGSARPRCCPVSSGRPSPRQWYCASGNCGRASGRGWQAIGRYRRSRQAWRGRAADRVGSGLPFVPLFTGVRGTGILRSSRVRNSRKVA
jgi:AzlC protein